jgi:hypothetical protein
VCSSDHILGRKDGAKFLKCDDCAATAVIRDGIFALIKPHTCLDVENLESDHEDKSYADSNDEPYVKDDDDEIAKSSTRNEMLKNKNLEQNMKDGDAKMSKRVKQLKRLKSAKSRTRNKMLKNTDLLRCICECALNILKDNVPLTQSQFQKLQQYKHVIKKLASKLVSDKQKVKIVQNGDGLLGKIITPALNQLNLIEEKKYEMDTDESNGSDNKDVHDRDSTDDSDDSCFTWSSYHGSEPDTDESSDTEGEESDAVEEEESEETESNERKPVLCGRANGSMYYKY